MDKQPRQPLSTDKNASGSTVVDRLRAGQFIAADENYSQLLEDDRVEVETLQTSNKKLAEALYAIRNSCKAYTADQKVQIGDKVFQVEVIHYRGKKHSAFDASAWTDKTYKVIDLETGDVLLFSGLAPEQISEVGFYGGRSSPYRLSPSRIKSFFG